MSIIQFNLDDQFKNKEFFELQDYLNNTINNIVSFINNLQYESIKIEFEHNFRNEKISNIYLRYLYCSLKIRIKDNSFVNVFLSKNEIESYNLTKKNILLFSDIFSIINSHFNLQDFEQKFIKIISLVQELNKKSEKNIYQDYDQKIKTIVEYFKINQEKYIKNNENNEFSYINIQLYKDKKNNLILLNSTKYKSFFKFNFYLKVEDQEIIKQLFLQNKEKEAIDFYHKQLQSINPFMYAIFSSCIEISKSTYTNIMNKQNYTSFRVKSLPIEVLYERIVLEKQLNNF